MQRQTAYLHSSMFSYLASWFRSEPVSPEIKQEVQKLIDSNHIMVFSKSYCPYCHSTKELFLQLNAKTHVVELDLTTQGSTMQRALQEITGQRTVPNIFINQKHIGGNSDLQELHRSGKLSL